MDFVINNSMNCTELELNINNNDNDNKLFIQTKSK